jgi:hypothetical protein
MSSWSDVFSGVPSVQDALFLPPQSSLPSQPVDTAGGSPGNYGAQIMDLFKFGIGAWQSNQAQSNAIDYKKWETTAGIATQQGQISANAVNRTQAAAPSSMGTMMMIGGLILAVMVLKKG